MNVSNQSFEINRIVSDQRAALLTLLREAVAKGKTRNGLSLAALAPLMAACGGGTVRPPPPPPPEPQGKFTLANGNEYTGTNYDEALDQSGTDVWLVVDALGGNDTINTGSGADFIDGGSGNDTINSGAGNDMIRGGLGADTINAGVGNDIIIVVGVTSATQYTSSSITNPAGTGKNLSKLISLADLNGQTSSEAVDGEIIDGGTGTNTLYVYGTVDFTNVTITNINQVVVNSDVTFADNQLGVGGITKITGDGGSTIRLESDSGSAVTIDLSTIDMTGVHQFEVGSNVTLVAASVEELLAAGLSIVSGGGSLQVTEATGSVDLSGLALESSLRVEDAAGTVMDSADTGANIVTSAQIANNANVAPSDMSLSTPWVTENEDGAVVGDLRLIDLDAGDSHIYSITDSRFEVVGGQLKLKAGVSLDNLAGSTLYFDVTARDAAGLAYTETFKIKVIPKVSSGEPVAFTIPYGDFAGKVLHFNDPLLPFQSNLLGFTAYTGSGELHSALHINLLPVWQEYSGKGIYIGNPETINFHHEELQDNYIIRDLGPFTEEYLLNIQSDNIYHGTATAGVISAGTNNGVGLVGIAFDAKISSVITTTGLNNVEYEGFDVITDSSGSVAYIFFSDGFNDSANTYAQLARDGREGLGMVWVISVGNGSANDKTTGASPFNNKFELLPVGLLGENGFPNSTDYGAGLHITAPLTTLGDPGRTLTLDNPGDLGLVSIEGHTTDHAASDPNDFFPYHEALGYDLDELGLSSGDYTTLGGSSGTAPTVAASVALMLEASGNNIFNSTGLGWRDVQEILALSSRHTGTAIGDSVSDVEHHPWVINGAENFNGGGMHFAPDYGFGMLDVHGAVRLVETWSLQRMTSNLVTQTETVTSGSTIAYGTAVDIAVDISGNADLDIDVVSLDLDITHDNWSELQITLISPDGTQSIVMDTPGLTAGNANWDDMTGQMIWTVLSRAFWGENSQGVWTIRIEDMVDNGNSGSIASIDAHFQGDLNVDDDTYFWTDDWALMNDANGGLPTINDSTGNNTINAAAVSDDLGLDMTAGSTSTIGGVEAFSLGASTTITTGITGDGNDTIKGIGSGDSAYAMRGDDRIETSVLTFTRLDGHEGIDTLALTGGNMDLDVSAHVAAGSLTGFEVLDFTASGSQSANLTAADIIALSDTNSLTVMGDASDSITLDDSGWTNEGQTTKDGEDYTIYTNGDATVYLDPDLSVYFG